MAVTDTALLAANWKMNPTDGGDALELVKGILPVATSSLDNVEVALFPPFPWLAASKTQCRAVIADS